MEIADRIGTIIKVNQHTAASFAALLGVQPSAISHILKGRNKPSLEVLQRILTHFPRVDAGWLISGKEPVAAQPSATIAAPAELPTSRQPVLVTVFYSDGTFTSYRPAAEQP